MDASRSLLLAARRFAPSSTINLLAFACAALLCACQDEAQKLVDQEPVVEEAQAREGSKELDALRALGYSGASADSYADEELGVGEFSEDDVAPGYNLHSNTQDCSAVLTNLRGEVIKRWQRKDHTTWSNVQLLPNGDLLAIGWEDEGVTMEGIDEDRYLMRLAWDNSEVWRVRMNAHHDLEVTPEGQLAVLGFKNSTGTSLTRPGVILREDTIHLLDLETGEEQGVRSFVDVLSTGSAPFEVGRVQPQEIDGVRFVDLYHLNSVEFTRDHGTGSTHPLHQAGNVLVSSRHQNTLFLFHWESGELLWTWGRQKLKGPHDASVLENGNLLVFDNGLGRGWSRVIELDPRTGEVLWTYKGTPRKEFYTASRGSSQRLPNGNTLIAESDRGRAFEVDKNGTRVWSWINPDLSDEGNSLTMFHFKRLPVPYVLRILESR